MAVRLKKAITVNGVEYPAGTILDLDALGLHQQSMIAQGEAEPVDTVTDAVLEQAAATGTPVDEAAIRAAAEGDDEDEEDNPQTMSRKARGEGRGR